MSLSSEPSLRDTGRASVVSPPSETLLAQRQTARLHYNVAVLRWKPPPAPPEQEPQGGFFSLLSTAARWVEDVRYSWRIRWSKEFSEISINDEPQASLTAGCRESKRKSALTNPRRSTLSMLPPEIVGKILNYLSPREIASAQRVRHIPFH